MDKKTSNPYRSPYRSLPIWEGPSDCYSCGFIEDGHKWSAPVCRFSLISYHVNGTLIKAAEHCALRNPRGECKDFEPVNFNLPLKE